MFRVNRVVVKGYSCRVTGLGLIMHKVISLWALGLQGLRGSRIVAPLHHGTSFPEANSGTPQPDLSDRSGGNRATELAPLP